MNRLCRAWCCLPFVDTHSGAVSITRVIALYFAWVVGQSIHDSHGVVSLNTFWLALATLAAAFGKSTFGFLLQKVQIASTIAATEASTRTTTDGAA